MMARILALCLETIDFRMSCFRGSERPLMFQQRKVGSIIGMRWGRERGQGDNRGGGGSTQGLAEIREGGKFRVIDSSMDK